MFARLIQLCSAALFACAVTASLQTPTLAANDGIVRVKSAYPIGETIERLKKDIADKGIKFFNEIDQSKLAADAGIKLRPSVLLIFGNHCDRHRLVHFSPAAAADIRAGFRNLQDPHRALPLAWPRGAGGRRYRENHRA
jgi:hypothetical protein